MNDFAEVTIIGGGVYRLSTAWELAKRKHRVRLVDTSSFGSGSSWAGAGILPPAATIPDAASEPIDQLRSISHQLYPEWTENIRLTSRVDTEFRRCGGLYLGRTTGERATLAAQHAHWLDLGITFQRLTLAELRQQHSSLQDLTSRLEQKEPQTLAWHLPDECTVRNPRLVQGLTECCRLAGVELLETARFKH